jgi:ATP-binding protein involved in chromosome partitioning
MTSFQWDQKSSVLNWLSQFDHPHLPEGWAESPNVLRVMKGNITITFPFASGDLQKALAEWIEYEKTLYTELTKIKFDIQQRVTTLAPCGDRQPLNGVKNTIVVSSAKGGVGKSTTSVNLALALQALGAKVGLLDADIYGPSVPLMLGTQGKNPTSADGKMMHPIEAHGLFTNSIGYLVSADNAMVWRGPMASKALSQITEETLWPELDYLVIDMPPGTGDIQLTLAQQLPVTGAVVITTPQDLALADAIKGVNMFEKVDVPVLGIVENMSYHVCSNCGHHEAIFGEGGAAKMAEKYHLPLLAQLPLDIRIRQDIDQGKPTVLAAPKSEQALRYRTLAEEVASRLFWQGKPIADKIAIMNV